MTRTRYPVVVESGHLLESSAPPVSWRQRAACRGEDPDLFYPVGWSKEVLDQIEDAKKVCARCPVRAQCLQAALDADEPAGVWGGLTREERLETQGRSGRVRTVNGVQVTAADRMLTARREEFTTLVGRGLSEAELARALRTNVKTVREVLARLAGEELNGEEIAAALDAVGVPA